MTVSRRPPLRPALAVIGLVVTPAAPARG